MGRNTQEGCAYEALRCWMMSPPTHVCSSSLREGYREGVRGPGNPGPQQPYRQRDSGPPPAHLQQKELGLCVSPVRFWGGEAELPEGSFGDQEVKTE